MWSSFYKLCFHLEVKSIYFRVWLPCDWQVATAACPLVVTLSVPSPYFVASNYCDWQQSPAQLCGSRKIKYSRSTKWSLLCRLSYCAPSDITKMAALIYRYMIPWVHFWEVGGWGDAVFIFICVKVENINPFFIKKKKTGIDPILSDYRSGYHICNTVFSNNMLLWPFSFTHRFNKHFTGYLTWKVSGGKPKGKSSSLPNTSCHQWIYLCCTIINPGFIIYLTELGENDRILHFGCASAAVL